MAMGLLSIFIRCFNEICPENEIFLNFVNDLFIYEIFQMIFHRLDDPYSFRNVPKIIREDRIFAKKNVQHLSNEIDIARLSPD